MGYNRSMAANERLRFAMVSAGFTARQLAEAVGVDPKTAERWVSTGRTPHPATAWKTADLLRADVLELWPDIGRGKRRKEDAQGGGAERAPDDHGDTRPITISVDSDLHDYVRREVEAGRAKSVSAYFNVAGQAVRLHREADAAWQAAVQFSWRDPDAFEHALAMCEFE
jgi:transcriptional regulator with XRE-family HTH domain